MGNAPGFDALRPEAFQRENITQNAGEQAVGGAVERPDKPFDWDEANSLIDEDPTMATVLEKKYEQTSEVAIPVSDQSVESGVEIDVRQAEAADNSELQSA